MALNDTALKALKPKEKAYTVADERGLYVEVFPTGGIVWRYRYRVDGRREKLTLGKYLTPKLFVSALLAEMRTFDAGGSCGSRPRARSTPERVRSKLESGPGQQRARYGERCSTQASATPFNDQPQARQCRRRPSGASARAAGAVLRRRIGS